MKFDFDIMLNRDIGSDMMKKFWKLFIFEILFMKFENLIFY